MTSDFSNFELEMKVFLPVIIAFYLSDLITAQLHPDKSKPIQLFSSHNLQEHINILGNDSLQGRGVGSYGERAAAEFLSKKMDEYAIKPMGRSGTYYQNIPLHGSLPSSECEMKIIYDGDSYNCKINQEFVLYTSGEQTFLSSPAELVFVGYGISAPEFDYNDYQSVDVLGKVAVFIDGEPLSTDENYFAGLKPTIYSYTDVKQQIALAMGAVGSILIPISENYAFKSWDEIVNEFLFENVTLVSSINKNLSLLFNPIYSYLLFKDSPYSLLDISDMYVKNKMQSFSMNCSIFFKGSFKERDFLSPNVIGMIEGSDSKLKDEYIIISAHYDHLGIGLKINGDSIYNGVLDNALGIAGVLELAKALSYSRKDLKRSVIFLFTTAEEKGLLGSIYYTSNPVVPLYKTIANVNIDGLAFIDEFNSLVGIGTEYSTLKKTFEETINLLNLKVGVIPEEFLNLKSFYQSDQIAFAAAGIPSLIIYDAVDYQNTSAEEGILRLINYSENIYHSPFDDLSQKINLNATVQHLKFIYNFIQSIASSNEKPVWNHDSPFIHERLRSIAEKR